MLSSTMLVQEATTDVIWAYSEAVQAVPSLPAATLAALVILAADVEEPFDDAEAVDLLTAELVVFACAVVLTFVIVELLD